MNQEKTAGGNFHVPSTCPTLVWCHFWYPLKHWWWRFRSPDSNPSRSLKP
jgi:hypothetical protein